MQPQKNQQIDRTPSHIEASRKVFAAPALARLGDVREITGDVTFTFGTAPMS